MRAVWNVARAWGYTGMPSRGAGIMSYSLGKREIYITEERSFTQPVSTELDCGIAKLLAFLRKKKCFFGNEPIS